MSTDALLPLRDVTSHLRVLGEHYVGVREIPIDRIVGSVNRSVDFDRFFRTGKRHLRKRLDALRDAFLPKSNVVSTGSRIDREEQECAQQHEVHRSFLNGSATRQHRQ